MTVTGVDYIWPATPGPVVDAGHEFVVRSLSTDVTKRVTQPEVQELHAAGLGVVLCWRVAADTALGGYDAGTTDATLARGTATAIGAPLDTPIYYWVGFPPEGFQMTTVLRYLDGAAAVEGPTRVGVYGTHTTITAAAGAGVTWLWQTCDFSAGRWHPRTQLRHTDTALVGGVRMPVVHAMTSDYGAYLPPAVPMRRRRFALTR